MHARPPQTPGVFVIRLCVVVVIGRSSDGFPLLYSTAAARTIGLVPPSRLRQLRRPAVGVAAIDGLVRLHRRRRRTFQSIFDRLAVALVERRTHLREFLVVLAFLFLFRERFGRVVTFPFGFVFGVERLLERRHVHGVDAGEVVHPVVPAAA